jgi:hypothetical protein
MRHKKKPSCNLRCDRWAAIVAMRCEGRTYEEIGLALGVTRQRISDILKDVRKLNPALARHLAHSKRWCRAKTLTTKSFKSCVQRWLMEAGYLWCCRCHVVKCREDGFSPKMRSPGHSCKRCSADRMNRYWGRKRRLIAPAKTITRATPRTLKWSTATTTPQTKQREDDSNN